ncbi:hypothetical protein M885DRAFT_526345 [Pelagophyceae sp. CCMP2097]|nr:hypothetical protein M885DRAFT_526345 [Pelagophyceae sp. CCMP2097]
MAAPTAQPPSCSEAASLEWRRLGGAGAQPRDAPQRLALLAALAHEAPATVLRALCQTPALVAAVVNALRDSDDALTVLALAAASADDHGLCDLLKALRPTAFGAEVTALLAAPYDAADARATRRTTVAVRLIARFAQTRGSRSRRTLSDLGLARAVCGLMVRCVLPRPAAACLAALVNGGDAAAAGSAADAVECGGFRECLAAVFDDELAGGGAPRCGAGGGGAARRSSDGGAAAHTGQCCAVCLSVVRLAPAAALPELLRRSSGDLEQLGRLAESPFPATQKFAIAALRALLTCAEGVASERRTTMQSTATPVGDTGPRTTAPLKDATAKEARRSNAPGARGKAGAGKAADGAQPAPAEPRAEAGAALPKASATTKRAPASGAARSSGAARRRDGLTAADVCACDMYRSGVLANIAWLVLHENASISDDAAACVAYAARSRPDSEVVDWFASFVEQGCIGVVFLAAALTEHSKRLGRTSGRRTAAASSRQSHRFLEAARACLCDGQRPSTAVLVSVLATADATKQLRRNVATALVLLALPADGGRGVSVPAATLTALASAVADEAPLLEATAVLVRDDSRTVTDLLSAAPTAPPVQGADAPDAVVESPRSGRTVKMNVPPLAVLRHASPALAARFENGGVVVLRGAYGAWEDALIHVAAPSRAAQLIDLALWPRNRLLAVFDVAKEAALCAAAEDAEAVLVSQLAFAADDEATLAVLQAALDHRAPGLAAAAFRRFACSKRRNAGTAPEAFLRAPEAFLRVWLEALAARGASCGRSAGV